MQNDLNLWGIFAMPVGLVLCFGPALLAWIREERRARAGATDAPERPVKSRASR